ncbi:MAG TPA: nucleotidyltransferase family protein [Candidatus Saccharimonadales bacterium]|nr:nucleotidyltransferase family protein [Candidatus Saccharimonadales bacterium]
MKAMILAAGLGTRLRPLTDDRPKALVEIAGRTMLEIALGRLRGFGIREVIVNVHHFADLVVECLKANDNFGMKIEISREEELLDTGGGLQKAAHFFLKDGGDEPFILHNVDVLSTIDFGAMVQFHREHEALATLAVQKRESSRQLLFDREGLLCGRLVDGETHMARLSENARPRAFAGIHVISPRLFTRMSGGHMKEEHSFPIIPVYLRLAGEGDRIVAFPADEYYWRDLGTEASLLQASRDVRQGALSQ